MSQAEKRNLLAGFFITALIAIAYQEMVNAVRDSVRAHGVSFGTMALAIIFLLTTIRFLVGNQLHLISKPVQEMHGFLWFYDVTVIMLQTVAMIFLGGLASIEVSSALQISFFEILALVFFLDVIWILSQWFLGCVCRSCKRSFIPWGWLYLNVAMLICLIVAYAVFGKSLIYSNSVLAYILGANILAFGVDIFLLDYHDVI